ncbi:MAG: hypothetical protein ACJ71P_02610 [Nitrososphaeraceae archaeon]
MTMTSGWLFDAYPLDNKMIFWIKQENGNTIRIIIMMLKDKASLLICLD